MKLSCIFFFAFALHTSTNTGTQTHGRGDSSVGLTVLRHARTEKSERTQRVDRGMWRGDGRGAVKTGMEGTERAEDENDRKNGGTKQAWSCWNVKEQINVSQQTNEKDESVRGKRSGRGARTEKVEKGERKQTEPQNSRRTQGCCPKHACLLPLHSGTTPSGESGRERDVEGLLFTALVEFYVVNFRFIRNLIVFIQL